MRKRDVYYWQERSILNKLDQEWKEHLVFKIIDDEEITGTGAATPNKEFGETFKTSMAIVESLRKTTENFDDLNNIIDFENNVHSLIKKDMAAKTTVFLAVYDYISNKNKINLENYYFNLNDHHKKDSYERIIINENTKNKVSESQNVKLDVESYVVPEKLIEIINNFDNSNITVDFSGLYNPFEIDFIIKNINNSRPINLEQPFKYGQEHIAKEYLNMGHKVYWDESFHNIFDFHRIKKYSTGFVFSLSKMASLLNISTLLRYVKENGFETVISSKLEHPINLKWSNKISNAFDITDLNYSKYIKTTNK